MGEGGRVEIGKGWKRGEDGKGMRRWKWECDGMGTSEEDIEGGVEMGRGDGWR